MSATAWVLYNERVVGQGSPVYPTDVINRPLEQIVTQSGYNPVTDTVAFAKSVHTHDASAIVSGQLPAVYGGTGLTTPLVVGDTIYASTTTAFSRLGIGTSNQFLTVQAGLPAWHTLVSADVSDATASNAVSTIVKRDGSGNFSAGTITASLTGAVTGNASTATALQTARTINTVSFDGTANIVVTAAAGTLTGTTLNATVVTSSLTALGTVTSGTWASTAVGAVYGGTGQTTYVLGDILYSSLANTLARLPGNATTQQQFLIQTGTGSASAAPAWHTLVTADVTDLASATTGITKVGTITTGTWNAGIITGTYGGTGVNNGASTITIGGSLTFSGAFATTITVTAGTSVTLPTSGTLVNTAVTTLSSLTTVGTIGTGVWQGTVVGATYGGTGINNGANTITLAGALVTSGAFSITLTSTGTTNVTLPTSGMLVNTAVTSLASLTSVGGAFAIAGAFTGATTGAFSDTVTITQGTANHAIITATGYSLTGSNATSLVSYAGTWNTTGVATAFKLAITNTASGAGSFLMNLLAGNAGTTSEFSVDPSGNVVANGTFTSSSTTDSSSSTTGGGIFSGGVGIAKKLYVGTALDVGTTAHIAGAVTLDATLGVGGSTTIVGDWRVPGRLLTVQSTTTGVGMLELATTPADATGQPSGTIMFSNATQNAGYRDVGVIEVSTSGATAGKRGSTMSFFTRKDNTPGDPSAALTLNNDQSVLFYGAVSGVTTLATSGTYTSSKTSGAVVFANSATTGNLFFQLINNTGQLIIGIESSAGGSLASGTAAYATVMGSNANSELDILSNNRTEAVFPVGGGLTVLRGTTAVQALTATTGGFSGNVTVTNAVLAASKDQSVNYALNLGSVTSTAGVYAQMQNGTGQGRFGIESSVAGTTITGTSAYATFYGAQTNHALDLFTNATVRWAIAAGGDFLPAADNTYNIGSASLRVNEMYINPAASGVGDTYICLSTSQQIHTGATCAASTELVKQDFAPITGALDLVMALEPTAYQFRDGYYGGRREYGLRAERTARVSPLLTFAATHDDTLADGSVIKAGDPYAVNPLSATALLVAAVQEQQAMIDMLNDRVNSLAGIN